MNNKKQELAEINKWKICFVDFWMNVWTEINGRRPAIIYKHNDYKFWEDVIVIPITSYEDEENKSKDTFDVEIEANDINGLTHKSLIKVRQIKCISKKRLQTWKESGIVIINGKIDDEEIKKLVDSNVRVMFGI
jgi:mRNA-degrading endonuclease toxin of MazEF toxin-antitoxin module